MYEVEVKVPADLDAVGAALEGLAASRSGAVRQSDAYYDHPARAFAETDEAVRIRTQHTLETAGPPAGPSEATTWLTYKGPRAAADAKTRHELETAVDDPQTMAGILEALGFEEVAVVRKERERYGLDGLAVALDRVDGVGTFVEIEAVGEEAAIAELGDDVRRACSRLGLDPADHVPESYLELLLDE